MENKSREQTMTDKEKLISLLLNFNMEYQVFNEEEYIMTNAIELGAVETICIRGEVEVAFDAKGKQVGSYTNSSGSWRPGK